MQHDEEGQEFGRALIQAPMQHGGQHDGMAEAADRKQLRGTLQDGDDEGLDGIHAGFAPSEHCSDCSDKGVVAEMVGFGNAGR